MRGLLWRGSLLPLGCGAALKPETLVVFGTPRWLGLRLLRSRAGASSLATGGVVVQLDWGDSSRASLAPTGITKIL
ncbi:hypothetical protein EMIT0P100_110171 [Pseudomonas sp. IT-P100]